MERLLSMYSMFGVGYVVYFVLRAGIVLGLVFGLKKLESKARKIAQIVLISCIGLFALIEYISRLVATPDTKFGDQMPLDMIEVLAGFSIFIFFAKKSSWKKFSYLIISPVSLYAIVFVPSVYGQMATISITMIAYYLTYAVMIANGILNILWLDQELEKKDILEASMTFVIVLATAHILNILFRFAVIGVHANYLGTMGEEYDLLIGWLFKIIPIQFLCILPLIAVLVGIQFLLVLPFDLYKTKREAKAQVEELIALGNLNAQAEYRKKHSKGKSQILVRSETKASPTKSKDVSQKSSDEGFVQTTKQVKVNNDKDN